MSGTDHLGTLNYTALGDGARLPSRTIVGKAGAAAAGKTVYLHRGDLTKNAGFTDSAAGLVLNFGAVTQLNY